MLTFFRYLLALFLSLFFSILSAQEIETEKPMSSIQDNRLIIDAFAYPDLMFGERHAWFSVNYKLSPKFWIELQGFYDTYILSDVFRVPLRAKYYITDKFYIFSGVEAEMERNTYSLDGVPIKMRATSGAGYEFTKNLLIEASYNLQFGQGPLGNYGTPDMLNLTGRYRF